MGLLEAIGAARAVIELIPDAIDAIRTIINGVKTLFDQFPDSPEKEQARQELAALEGKYTEVV